MIVVWALIGVLGVYLIVATAVALNVIASVKAILRRYSVYLRRHEDVIKQQPDKTVQMELLEAREGKPIRVILAESYARTGRIKDVAAEVGITYQALWLWMKMLRVTVEDLKRMAQKPTNGKDGE